jgi:hypothetical protein
MVAHYDDYNGMFEVDLWQDGKGFILDLTHEYDYELDPERREALVPALSRNERDHFLDACYSLFGGWRSIISPTSKIVVNRTLPSQTGAANFYDPEAPSRRLPIDLLEAHFWIASGWPNHLPRITDRPRCDDLGHPIFRLI